MDNSRSEPDLGFRIVTKKRLQKFRFLEAFFQLTTLIRQAKGMQIMLKKIAK